MVLVLPAQSLPRRASRRSACAGSYPPRASPKSRCELTGGSLVRSEEDRAVQADLQGEPRLITTLSDGAGLRLPKYCRPPEMHVDFPANQTTVRRDQGDRASAPRHVSPR